MNDFFSSSEQGQKEELVSGFENYLRGEGQRLNTIKGNSGTVSNFLDWLAGEQIPYLEVSYNDLLEWINHCKQKGNSKRTLNGKLQGVKHFYNYLEQSGKVKHNPCEELRIKGVIRKQPHDLLEWEELEQLYQDYPSSGLTGKRNKAILGMLIYQGLNSGEVAGLEVKDLKLEEGKVYVPAVGRSNSRTLKLESGQILQLQKYLTQVRPVILAITEKESEKLFISTGAGNRLDNSLSRLMKKAREINPKVREIQQIRASVITYWLKKHNIRQVQYMTGHKYVSSTERYRTDLLESLQDQIDEIHPLK